MMLPQEIPILQCPPVSDIADFSHLAHNHLSFSAAVISPCQLLKPVSVPDGRMSAKGFRVEILPMALLVLTLSWGNGFID